MTTLTAIVLRGHSYTLAHVGDSRAWLLRDGRCDQLTQDHVFDHPDMRSRVTRAVGLDEHVHPDYASGELRPGDVFALTSDGVHGAIRATRFADLLKGTAGDAQAVSEALVGAAVEAGTRDNASALVIKVRELAGDDLPDAVLRARSLPAAPRLKVGDALDDFVVTALLRDTGVHRLYQARHAVTGELVAIKTLHESRAGDAQERAMLAHEAWLGQQLGAAGGFVAVREQPQASALYVVFDWHGGVTLQQALDHRQAFSVAQVVQGAVAIARALGRAHRLGVVHRDIKPANLHLGDDGTWRILDLGVAISGRESAEQRRLHAGTPSYMNPEQWEEQGTATAQSDLFALGVTLYQWLTGHLPYGEIEPYQRARFRRDPRAPSRLRPDVPIWLDHVVLKAVALDPRQRFETAEEFVLALERGASRPLDAAPVTPLFARDPASVWKVALAVSAALNLLLIYWLLFLPR
jgi:serine/threonine protein phosphatase PrpC